MNDITTLGIDLAKSVFQLHGVGADGRVLLRRQLRRSQMLEFFQRLPPCLIGIEACASAHYWTRELTKFGHDIRLMQPSHVKGYVKRGKTDSETGPWPQMRPRKPVERCRGDLRSRFTPLDAVCPREERRHASPADDARRTRGALPAQRAGISGAPANPDCERVVLKARLLIRRAESTPSA